MRALQHCLLSLVSHVTVPFVSRSVYSPAFVMLCCPRHTDLFVFCVAAGHDAVCSWAAGSGTCGRILQPEHKWQPRYQGAGLHRGSQPPATSGWRLPACAGSPSRALAVIPASPAVSCFPLLGCHRLLRYYEALSALYQTQDGRRAIVSEARNGKEL